VKIDIPPLRQRPTDILWLAQQFIVQNAQHVGRKEVPKIASEVKQAMLEYSWPGNVRELKNAIDRACIFCDGDQLTTDLLGLPGAEAAQSSLDETLEQAERNKIIGVLADNDFKIQQSAEALGISRKGLWQKMKRLNIRKVE